MKLSSLGLEVRDLPGDTKIKFKIMSDKVVVSNKSMGIGTILFIVFLVLKLTDNIDWSWWWVTAPIWIPVAIFIVLLVIALIGFVGAAIAKR